MRIDIKKIHIGNWSSNMANKATGCETCRNIFLTCSKDNWSWENSTWNNWYFLKNFVLFILVIFFNIIIVIISTDNNVSIIVIITDIAVAVVLLLRLLLHTKLYRRSCGKEKCFTDASQISQRPFGNLSKLQQATSADFRRPYGRTQRIYKHSFQRIYHVTAFISNIHDSCLTCFVGWKECWYSIKRCCGLGDWRPFKGRNRVFCDGDRSHLIARRTSQSRTSLKILVGIILL